MAMSLEWYRQALANHGIASLLRLQLQKRIPARSRLLKLTSKQLRHPVYARRGTSDLLVFEQILTAREYRCLDILKAPRLIIDCGANVGYSSAYFLSKFEDCYVIAVEPDADNFAMLERNLLPYRGRCRPIRAAVWPHAEPLQMKAGTTGAGREWGRSIEPKGVSTLDCIDAIDLPTLISLGGFDRVSILKVDIEGAETELFRVRYDRWLDLVDNIVIELHGAEARQAFFEALPRERFNVSTCDELTVCLSRHL
jgi:FkbM family methyltransferase